MLRENPFYVESGGQVSDIGALAAPDWSLAVDSVRKDPKGTVVGGTFEDEFDPTTLRAAVDAPRRHDIERNHSATHLVHYALRKHLGPHVRQQGSLVQPDRLRFDFSHHGPIDADTLHRIEGEVNDLMLDNALVSTREMAYPDALALGAMAFFSEKYGDVVRVVQMGPSVELCGGTHVRSSGQIGTFRFSAQSGVAAGVRRIEAVTGSGALRAVRELEQRLAQVADALKSQPEHLVDGSNSSSRSGTGSRHGSPTRSSRAVAATWRRGGRRNGVKVTIADTATDDRDEVGQIADRFREGKRNSLLVLFSTGGRGAIHVTLTDDLVSAGRKAGDLVNRIAALSGGKGGGRPHFASAGAGDPARLSHARAPPPPVSCRPGSATEADGARRLARPAHQSGPGGAPHPRPRACARRETTLRRPQALAEAGRHALDASSSTIPATGRWPSTSSPRTRSSRSHCWPMPRPRPSGSAILRCGSCAGPAPVVIDLHSHLLPASTTARKSAEQSAASSGRWRAWVSPTSA